MLVFYKNMRLMRGFFIRCIPFKVRYILILLLLFTIKYILNILATNFQMC